MLSSVETTAALSFLDYMRVFGWTCGLEAIVYLPLLLLKRNSLGRSLMVVVLANLATHPLVTFVFPRAGQAMGLGVAFAVVIKELFAPVAETLVVRRMTNLTWAQSAAVSFAANLFSWWAGAVLADQIF